MPERQSLAVDLEIVSTMCCLVERALGLPRVNNALAGPASRSTPLVDQT
jgi:hypothetical protein